MVATLLGQLLGDDGLMCSCKFAVASYEVTDAKVVDVCIVACVLTGEILAEIVVVHANMSPSSPSSWPRRAATTAIALSAPPSSSACTRASPPGCAKRH